MVYLYFRLDKILLQYTLQIKQIALIGQPNIA